MAARGADGGVVMTFDSPGRNPQTTDETATTALTQPHHHHRPGDANRNHSRIRLRTSHPRQRNTIVTRYRPDQLHPPGSHQGWTDDRGTPTTPDDRRNFRAKYPIGLTATINQTTTAAAPIGTAPRKLPHSTLHKLGLIVSVMCQLFDA
jgi:hypothetical protein